MWGPKYMARAKFFRKKIPLLLFNNVWEINAFKNGKMTLSTDQKVKSTESISHTLAMKMSWNLAKLRKIFIKIRTSSQLFPLETQRWPYVSYVKDFAHFVIQVKFQYILEWKLLCAIRKQFLHSGFCTNPNVITFSEIISISCDKTLTNLSTFTTKCTIYSVLNNLSVYCIHLWKCVCTQVSSFPFPLLDYKYDYIHILHCKILTLCTIN
jgi:hypothetical protein